MDVVAMLLAPSAVVLLIGAIRAVIVGRSEHRSRTAPSGAPLVATPASSTQRNS